MSATLLRRDIEPLLASTARWLRDQRRIELCAAVITTLVVVPFGISAVSSVVPRYGSFLWGVLATLMLATSAAALFLVGHSPRLAALLSSYPFIWLLWDDRWLVHWWIAQLGVLALAVARSWRHAVWPAVGALVSWVLMFTDTSHIVWVDGNVLVSAPSEQPVPYLLTVLAAALLPAAGAALLKSGAAQRALSKREAVVKKVGTAQAERARLARDLHDVVAHHVSLIAVRAETAPYTEPDLPEAHRPVLQEIAGDARRALDELRGVLGVLQRSEDRPELAPQPTLQDLPELVDRACRAGDRVAAYGVDGAWIVPDTVGYVAYRVVQEALTNARRHAPRAPVEVWVERDGDELVVTVANQAPPDARAWPHTSEASEGDGLGLSGMTERVEALGGILVAGPDAAGGFRVTARLPIYERGR